jgi:DNA repair protein RadC
MDEKSMHTGHRERLKRRFLEEGLDNFTDVQALELLLFYGIVRQDTNPIAHNLIEHFGSLSQVLEASPAELKKVKGISEHTAVLLNLIPQLGRYYQVDATQRMEILPTLDACGAYLVPRFFGRTRETVFLLCLDAKCKVLCCKEIGEGSVNAASISQRKVVETALAANATTVILAHNHPSGMAIPSLEDMGTTKDLELALKSVGVPLLEHYIVAQGKYLPLMYKMNGVVRQQATASDFYSGVDTSRFYYDIEKDRIPKYEG